MESTAWDALEHETASRDVLDFHLLRWHQNRTQIGPLPHETVLPETLHLVEQPDLRHAIMDLAVWRAGGRGCAGQPLLPDPRRRGRSDPAFPAALGDLQRYRRSEPDSAGLAWLDASHRRCAPD